MARIIIDPMDHHVDIKVSTPSIGKVSVKYHGDDRKRVRAALESIGMKLVPIDTELRMAGCDIELTTDDIKALHSGEDILLNGGPFGIYVRLVKTPLDYLSENPLPHQQGNHS